MESLEFYKNRKKELKLTNEDIANQSGIPIRTVEDFFRGASRDPRLSTVRAIEQVLGISSVISNDERSSGVVDTLRVSITAEEDNLLVLYREIGRKKGADRQRLFMQMGRLILELE